MISRSSIDKIDRCILLIRYYLFVFDDNFIINIVLAPLTRSTGTAGDTLAVADTSPGASPGALWTLPPPVLLTPSTSLVFAPVVAAVAPLLVAGTEIVRS